MNTATQSTSARRQRIIDGVLAKHRHADGSRVEHLAVETRTRREGSVWFERWTLIYANGERLTFERLDPANPDTRPRRLAHH